MDKRKINKQLKIYINNLLQDKSIATEQVVLFGSFAEGRATEYSDIDLLVIGQFYNIPKDNRYDLLYSYHKDLDSNYDFNVYGLTPTEYNKIKPWSMLSEIREKGEVLYKKD
jgi:predicted nucleotidyltransferase